jgi:hypothetical protein
MGSSTPSRSHVCATSQQMAATTALWARTERNSRSTLPPGIGASGGGGAIAAAAVVAAIYIRVAGVAVAVTAVH